MDELTRQALHVRVRELRHLERCERGLAVAYRDAHSIPGIPDRQLADLSARHREHAEVLRARILAMSGTPDEESEDVWVTGLDRTSLSFSEHTSLAVYHDHLTDFDRSTADAIRRFILPEHAAALEVLDPAYVRDRDGDI